MRIHPDANHHTNATQAETPKRRRACPILSINLKRREKEVEYRRYPDVDDCCLNHSHYHTVVIFRTLLQFAFLLLHRSVGLA
jgi:hypothetical protein